MLYGKMYLLRATLISFLHSVQIMARHLVLLITLATILKLPLIQKSPLQEITYMLYGKKTLFLVWLRLISFLHSGTDNGQTFSPPINLSNNTRDFSDPQISSSGNNVYVVWEDSTLAGGDDDIFFAFSTDNGQTFSTPDNLSESTENSPLIHKSLLQEITYMLYGKDIPHNNGEIFFAFSTDNGQTFSIL